VRGFGEAFDRVEPPVPLSGEFGHGPGGLVEAVSFHLVENFPALLAPADQPGPFEHDQVLGDRLARERHPPGQPAGADFAVADQQVEHPATRRVADGRPELIVGLRRHPGSRFASTLSILTGSGAPLLRALDTAAGVVWARPMRRAADAVAAHVREGVSLARALASQRVFPPLLVHLVANGEQSGQLPAMLDRAAREQEQDVERRLTWLAALVQPLLIVFMGAIVLVLVLAVMLPIVSMNQLIR